MKIRLAYSKLAEAKYVAHLDLTRFLDRALRRAEIAVAFSQGFNPHPKISFGPPLAVGVEGLAEYVDVELRDPRPHMSPRAQEACGAEAVAALTRQMPERIKISTWKLLPPGAPALTAAINLAVYEVWLPLLAAPSASVAEDLAAWLAQPVIMIERPAKEKKPAVQKDIRPFIARCEIREICSGDHLSPAGAETPAQAPALGLLLEIRTGNAGSVKALEVLAALSAGLQLPWDREGVSIVRTGLYIEQGDRRLTPLD
jgi:radical SAM-linked protein